MATKWIAAAPGIRYRTHATRKHGAKIDRYYTLRFSVAGKQVEEALGWASEGWTVKLAQEKLADGARPSAPARGTLPCAKLLRPTAGQSARRPRPRRHSPGASAPFVIYGIATAKK